MSDTPGSALPESSRPWTPEETAAADAVIAHLRRTIASLDDLLTPEEKASLDADLAEMARIRRQAEAASANWPMA
jgi:hypothetical protein